MTNRLWRAVGAVALSTALIAVAAPAEAKTWTLPEGAQIISVKVKKTKHKVTTTTTYRPLKQYQTTASDLVGSIICTATSRVLIGKVPDATMVEADAQVRDDNVVTVEGLKVVYSGTCETTNVFIPDLGNIVIGYKFDTSWISEEVKPVGATFVPWDVDRMILPVIPYYGDPVKVKITKSIRRHK